MKAAIIAVVALLVIGGAVGGAWVAGVGPFHKDASGAKHATAKPDPKAAAAATGGKPDVAADIAVQPAAAPRHPRRAAAAPADPEAERAQQEQRLAQLSSVYEQMPAEDAGRILSKLPDPLVEELLRRMDERQAGKLLLTQDLNRAARLTLALSRKPDADGEPLQLAAVPTTAPSRRRASRQGAGKSL